MIEGAVDTAVAAPFKKGDVFASIGSGKVQHYDANLNLIETLVDTGKGGYTTGMAFDKDGNLYVTNVTVSLVSVFRTSDGALLGTFGSGHSIPESIAFDRNDNVYVGNIGNGIRQYDANGNLLRTIIDTRVDWHDITADNKTIYFTQEGRDIKTVDIATGQLGPNFTTGTAIQGFALRILSDEGVLLADRLNVKRYNKSGKIIQTYDVAGQDCWFALSLDSDGTSFWSGDFCTSNFYKFDIASGAVLASKNTGTGYFTLFGLSIFGEITAARPSGFNSVRVIDTISTSNIDLDTSSFSRQPVSITQNAQNNQTIIEWQYSSFTIGQLEKLNFDVILKNPIPGEDRLVNHKLELIYTDIAGNQIRKELPSQYVHVLNSNFNIIPATDKPEYNANENGIINLSITNIGDMARTVDIHVNMVDSLGNIASQITVIPNTLFNAGQTLNFPNITFSTGNTFSGPYQIQATLYEQTKPAGRGKTDITIKSPIPSLGITSAITTDKMAYNTNESVKITSIITSTAQNYIYTNLPAKIKITNPNNQTINEYQRSILTLMPNSRNEGNIYFNTGSNPPGIYTITQEIYEGTQKISKSATNFTILSTAQTGIGIAGTIMPNPKTIIRWQPITINYNITNIGNSDISGLNLKILIMDPETGNAQITLTDTISQLNIGSTTTNLKIVPNLDLPVTKKPKDYLIILQGMLPAGAATIASSYITIMPALDITKETKGNARALIWLCKDNNNHNSSHNECSQGTDPLEPIIKEALKQLGIYYYLIVYDKKDFEAQLRSNEFNSYLIFNNHEPIEDHIDEELTEHINAGKGIIAFFIKKEEQHNHNNNDGKDLPIFGVKFKGYLPDEQRTLYLADTDVTDADTITTSGKVEKTELLPNTSAQIMAYFNDGTPAIITNTYGNGKAVLYTFDIRKTTETATAEQLTKLIMKAVKYTAPAKEPIISGGIIPITIKIQSLGTAATLKIEEQLPPNAMIITDSTAIRTGDSLSWAINIAANATKELTYYLIAPDAANITLNTGIYYLSTSTSSYELYDTIELKIDIKNSIVQIATAAIEKLNSLTLTDKKAEEDKTEIINILAELQNQTIPADKKDANKIWEEAIKKTLKAIDELIDIKEQLQKSSSLDINTEKTLTEIRLLLDELLMFAEIKWYGSR